MLEPPEVRSHKDLDVWKRAIALTERIYRETAAFPRDEIYGVTAQIRRAGVSIAANIAEGSGRGTTGQLIQFLRIAQGSAQELDTHVIISQKLGFLSPAVADQLQDECKRIGQMLRALIRSLEARSSRKPPD